MSEKRRRKGRSFGYCSLTKHHIVPRSRKGRGDGDTVKLPRIFHESWHDLFGLMTPEEAILYIFIVFKINITLIVLSLRFGIVKIECIVRYFSRRLLKNPAIFYDKWNILFGDLSPEKTILFIRIVMRSEDFGIRKKRWTMKELNSLRDDIKKIRTGNPKKIIKKLGLKNYRNLIAA